MSMPSAIVRADKATKIYQRDSIPVPALHETSVEILEGDFVALVGPSGSGKTTLLNLIGGLDRPTSGRIWVGDQEITSLGRKALAEVRLRHIGFVFQEYNLVPVLSALENVEYVMLLQGVDEERRRQEAMRLLHETSAWRVSRTAGPMNCRAASSSVWRWRAPSPRGR
ncbi:ATP-binding cassette domain-containing protein [Rhizobacter sp. J219]|uniref:ABC transporter ATP-binding protein n=1 Tax=Rhizobacter sp. J219 TaxID=2898430 RepID=UPI002151DD0F|nr:ATP-binding cassette domain-containing protein [Rhizobacter sp. J219]